MSAPRRISILGATGSVGLATLDLVSRAPEGAYRIIALTANRNAADLAKLARRHGAQFAAVADPAAGAALEEALSGSGVRCGAGPEAIIEAAAMDAGWVMAAIVGAAGLRPAMAAIETGAVIALANKECLVCAGDLFMQAAGRRGAAVLPVDSEHNAVFQALNAGQKGHVRRIVLTASGGPFLNWPLERMRLARVEDALAHPVWSMGDKISIDSATMMNKGLEVIEACRLFDLSPAQVDVVVHPQSIIHGMVEYQDGSLIAQMGSPDMRIPIAAALAWPERMPTPAARLDLAAVGRLDFMAPDPERFPALDLARAALEAGEGATAALNAANEVAVEAFLNERIGLLDICAAVADALETAEAEETLPKRFSGFDQVFDVDARARRLAMAAIARRESQRG
ncbi:MAG: 1-deoxy-D-xylulose-5-phosphate reductoisomerase [Maricaulaceae bacterium]|nr:1-deoxy-D-xylulose-5-phosphate reductoisomerase [Maricaulaceae bacterium]